MQGKDIDNLRFDQKNGGRMMKIGIVVAEFHYEITSMMVERAKAHAEFLPRILWPSEVTRLVSQSLPGFPARIVFFIVKPPVDE